MSFVSLWVVSGEPNPDWDIASGEEWAKPVLCELPLLEKPCSVVGLIDECQQPVGQTLVWWGCSCFSLPLAMDGLLTVLQVDNNS